MLSWFAPSPDMTTTLEQSLARRVRRTVRVIAVLSAILVTTTGIAELFASNGSNAMQRGSRLVLLAVVVSAAFLSNRVSNKVALSLGVIFPVAGVTHALYSIATSGGGASNQIVIFPITVVASTFIMVVRRRVSTVVYGCFLVAYITVILRYTPADAPDWALPNAIRWGTLGTALSVIGSWINFTSLRDSVEGRTALREESRRAALAMERTRLSRDLHDHIGARITGIALRAERAQKTLPPAAHETLAWMQQTAALCLDELRDTIWALSAAAQEPSVLAATLRRRAEDIAASGGLALAWHDDLQSSSGQVRPGVSVALSSILREALTNTLRHSGASSVRVQLRRIDDLLTLEISDDGHGIAGANDEGRGLVNMRARAAEEHAELKVAENAGGGVTISVAFPSATSA